MSEPQPSEEPRKRTFLTFDGMCWPHPDDPYEVEWALRYGQPTERQLLVAASFIESYRQLVYDPQRVRNSKIAGIRRAMTTALAKVGARS